MKTGSLFLYGAALIMAVMPGFLHAGEPSAPTAQPAVATTSAETRVQPLPPKSLPMATLLTFALMASSGSSLPQNPGPVK